MSSQATALVSVVMPVYNGAAYVAEAIESVLAQDHPRTELVVVNDGSTDDTLAVLATFGDRIRVVDQANAGPPAARNAGLAAARGDHIAFLDADDVWVPGKLSAQVRHLEAHPEVGTVFTGWRVWHAGSDGRFVLPPGADRMVVTDEIDPALSGWLYNRLLLDCELLTTTVMMRRSLVERLGRFDLALRTGEDYDYWLRASREARITKLASTGAHYRMLEGSASHRPQTVNFEYMVIQRALERWGLVGPDGTASEPAVLRQRLLRLALSHGHTHLTRGDPRIAYDTLRHELGRNPANLRLWVNTVRAAVKVGLVAPSRRAA